jgi:hypothetical protein
MPASSGGGKPFSIAMFNRLCSETKIDGVLDVGAGLGVYALVFRPAVPAPRWTAIEIWAPYVERFALTQRYDTVVVADARYVDYDKLPRFDLAIFGDVLEHMTKTDALAAISECLCRCRFVLVSLPIVYCPQEAYDGNPYEAHVKPDWTDAEARSSLPGLVVGVVDGDIGVYWLAREVEDANLLWRVATEVIDRHKSTGRWASDLGL